MRIGSFQNCDRKWYKTAARGEDTVMWKRFKMEGIQGMRREVWILEDR